MENKKILRVLNFGSLNYDYVYSVDHILQPGETIASLKRETFCGGKGMNQSIALARAGVNVYHAGLVGEEGKTFLDICKTNGVDTTYINMIEGLSGHTVIQVDKNGQNCILLYGGSNRKLTKEYIDKVINDFDDNDLMLIQNEVNLLDYIIDRAYSKGITIVLNPSPFDDALSNCDLSKISLFLLNEIEGEQITGEKEVEKILSKLQQLYPKVKIVLTLGKKGCIYQDEELVIEQPIYKVPIVDTTAAGDTFTGFFISGILKGLPEKYALQLAAKAAAISVTREGATTSIPLIQEVENYVFDND